MADRGEQRSRKQLYKPKQFQKKKRIHPRPARANEGSTNTNNSADNNNKAVDVETSSEEESREEFPSEQIAPDPSPASSNIERLLQSPHMNDGQSIYRATSVADQTAEDSATDLDQFLAEVEQPRTSPSFTGRLVII